MTGLKIKVIESKNSHVFFESTSQHTPFKRVLHPLCSQDLKNKEKKTPGTED